MDNTNDIQAVLSLCPGILGLERGLERAIGKMDIVAYVEIEAFIIANLVTQMEAGLLAAAPVWTNVKTFDAQPFRNKLHGIIGGYPCQPFSHTGKRKGADDPRHLWPYISNIIGITRPVWCYFENVSGHLSMGFEQVYRELSDLGYSVEAGLFTADEVGSPHKRQRLFILALDNTYCQLGTWCTQTQTRYRGKYSVSSKKMDNTISPRLERHTGYDIGEGGRTQQKRPVTETGLFPAGQGTFQYEWEEPRTIKSSLEYTINGYNFTEDLHRAIGNSVVEQTAELAFITLLEKHILNLIKP